MELNNRVEALSAWGSALSALIDEIASNQGEDGNKLSEVITKARIKNPWFTQENTIKALNAIVLLLEKEELSKWVKSYSDHAKKEHQIKQVAIIAAGNIPVVCFHDVLCVLASGHAVQLKLSSDDQVIMPFLFEVLIAIAPQFQTRISIIDRVKNADAIIATGSNNSARYFDFYFAKYPHIIRRNRNSIAVLSGHESEEQLRLLGQDIFDYFGMGCRNVSKIYIPKDYSFDLFFKAMEHYSSVMQHNKYMNNFDYHQALFLLNSESFLTNNFLIVREATSIATPVSVLHYEYYDKLDHLELELKKHEEQIQCRVGVSGISFGTAQQPWLTDYADGVDTMQWLASI